MQFWVVFRWDLHRWLAAWTCRYVYTLTISLISSLHQISWKHPSMAVYWRLYLTSHSWKIFQTRFGAKGQYIGRALQGCGSSTLVIWKHCIIKCDGKVRIEHALLTWQMIGLGFYSSTWEKGLLVDANKAGIFVKNTCSILFTILIHHNGSRPKQWQHTRCRSHCGCQSRNACFMKSFCPSAITISATVDMLKRTWQS
jgi:hypothetical protein